VIKDGLKVNVLGKVYKFVFKPIVVDGDLKEVKAGIQCSSSSTLFICSKPDKDGRDPQEIAIHEFFEAVLDRLGAEDWEISMDFQHVIINTFATALNENFNLVPKSSIKKMKNIKIKS